MVPEILFAINKVKNFIFHLVFVFDLKLDLSADEKMGKPVNIFPEGNVLPNVTRIFLFKYQGQTVGKAFDFLFLFHFE
jgi:hypothetical protein